MHSEVRVRLTADQEYAVDLFRLPPMGQEEARHWLDQQFMALDGVPLRPSGKVLLADKVLIVAQAAGARWLGETEWLHTFARAAHAVLAKPVIRVDVPEMTVSY